MAKFRGTLADLIRVWVVESDCNGDSFQEYFETREEAVRYVEELPRKDREHIVSIHETGAIELDGELIAFISYHDLEDTQYDVCSGEAFKGAEFVSEEELQSIIKNGRGLD